MYEAVLSTCVQPDFLAKFFPSVLGGVEGDEHSKPFLVAWSTSLV